MAIRKNPPPAEDHAKANGVVSDEGVSDTTLNAKPWTFAFTALPPGMDKIDITFAGSKTQGLGLAFNHFQPTTVPEPASISAIIAAAAILRRRWR
jgi:hypothetical protein